MIAEHEPGPRPLGRNLHHPCAVGAPSLTCDAAFGASGRALGVDVIEVVR
jgi:hypothetical protein